MADALIQPNRIEIPDPTEDQNILLVCPECKTLVPTIKLFISKGQALINIKCSCTKEDGILEISHYLDIMESSSSIKTKCVRHLKKTAVTHCPECSQWLCSECLKYHNQIAKTHLTSSKEVKLDKNCLKHKDLKLTLFCNQCQRSICDVCSQENEHYSHETVKIELLIKTIEQSKLYELFLERKSIIDYNKTLKDSLIRKIDEMIYQLNKQKEQIENEYKTNESINKELIKFIELLFLNYNATLTMPNYHIINNLIENTFFNIQQCKLDLDDTLRSTIDLTRFLSVNYLIKLARQSYKKYECITTFKGHKDYIKAMILLQDGKIATGSLDETIKIWDQIKFICSDTLKGHKGSIFALAQLKDGRLVSGSADETIKIWNVYNNLCLSTLKQRKGSIIRILLQLKDGVLASGTSDRKIDLWDMTALSIVSTLEGHSNWVISLIQFNDETIISGSADETIKLWNTETNEAVNTLKQHTSCVWALCLLEDGRMASASADNTIRLWDVLKGKCIKVIQAHKNGINALMLLQDGRIASSAGDKTVKIWDFNKANEQYVGVLEGHSHCVSSVIQLNDGRICSSSYDKTIKLWMI